MPSVVLAGILLSATNRGGNVNMILCEARKSSSGGHGGRSMPSRRSRSGSSSSSKRLSPNSRPSTRRKESMVVDEYDEVTEDEEDQFEFSDQSDDDEDGVSDSQCYDQDIGDDYDDDEYDSFEEERERPIPRRPQSRSTRQVAPNKASSSFRSSQGRSRPSQTSTRTSRASRPSSKSSRSSRSSSRSSSRRVVPYTNYRRPPSAFSRGLMALRESIPDPQTLKDTAISSISSAKETTTQLSSNLYREVKGLRSSELEQVFLKATKPDDSPIKNNFVEQLVTGTYHMTGVPDPWDFALRKLWSKMIESDWRTTLKAVYVLHRFGIDGAPEQRLALKSKLKKMRRTVDPKRKAKYFNTKQLLTGYSSPANSAFRAFLARYSHYVLLRVRCFGGLFSEIGDSLPSNKKNTSRSRSRNSASSSTPQKPITSTRLKKEHLDAAKLILKAGLTCKLKQQEECENTAIAMETVVADMIGLTSAVAKALNSALKSKYDEGDSMIPDKVLIQLWCEFYSQDLLPQTKAMMKSTTPTLDAYDLFLPSRIGTTVSQELLQKGLRFGLVPTVVESKDVNKDEEPGQGEGEDEGLKKTSRK